VTDPKTFVTPGGAVLRDEDVERIADEVEATEPDVSALRRRRGRPLLGSAPAEAVQVRLDPALHAALDRRAEQTGSTRSELVRDALRAFLDVA
jgi:hypothetical protein